MYRQIDVDCQTKNETFHCNDCIFAKTCSTKTKTDLQKQSISVVDTETVGVWKKWNKREALPT
ncbi:MAG: hypothetical protein ACM3UY_08185 [Methanocella sp.]|jgi:hypothetical protein